MGMSQEELLEYLHILTNNLPKRHVQRMLEAQYCYQELIEYRQQAKEIVRVKVEMDNRLKALDK